MTYPETTYRTPHTSGGRINERKGVVFHHTGGSFSGAVSWFMDPASRVSAHVVIAKDGRRAVIAPDEAVTWHAGVSTFKGRSACNFFMLGVEFELTVDDVRDGRGLTKAQIDSMIEWIAPRWEKYGWSMDWMTHHAEVSPGRKIDLQPHNWALVQDALRTRFESAQAPARSLYRVIVDGTQVGAYHDPTKAVSIAVSDKAKDIRLERI